jgi:hypothetical protein
MSATNGVSGDVNLNPSDPRTTVNNETNAEVAEIGDAKLSSRGSPDLSRPGPADHNLPGQGAVAG